MRITPLIRRSLLVAGLLAGLLGQAASPPEAGANHRVVIVNGALLGPQDLAFADRVAGFPLPNGNYWYDMQSGYWGLVGGPALGWVPPELRQGSRSQGWSYRNDTTGTGMIYNPDGATWKDQVWIDPD